MSARIPRTSYCGKSFMERPWTQRMTIDDVLAKLRGMMGIARRKAPRVISDVACWLEFASKPIL